MATPPTTMSISSKKMRIIVYQSQYGNKVVNIYKCGECSLSFPSLQHVHLHMKRHKQPEHSVYENLHNSVEGDVQSEYLVTRNEAKHSDETDIGTQEHPRTNNNRKSAESSSIHVPDYGKYISDFISASPCSTPPLHISSPVNSEFTQNVPDDSFNDMLHNEQYFNPLLNSSSCDIKIDTAVDYSDKQTRSESEINYPLNHVDRPTEKLNMRSCYNDVVSYDRLTCEVGQNDTAYQRCLTEELTINSSSIVSVPGTVSSLSKTDGSDALIPVAEHDICMEHNGGDRGVGMEHNGRDLGVGTEHNGADLGVGTEHNGADLGVGMEHNGADLGVGMEHNGGDLGVGTEHNGGDLGMGTEPELIMTTERSQCSTDLQDTADIKIQENGTYIQREIDVTIVTDAHSMSANRGCSNPLEETPSRQVCSSAALYISDPKLMESEQDLSICTDSSVDEAGTGITGSPDERSVDSIVHIKCEETGCVIESIDTSMSATTIPKSENIMNCKIPNTLSDINASDTIGHQNNFISTFTKHSGKQTGLSVTNSTDISKKCSENNQTLDIGHVQRKPSDKMVSRPSRVLITYNAKDNVDLHLECEDSDSVDTNLQCLEIECVDSDYTKFEGWDTRISDKNSDFLESNKFPLRKRNGNPQQEQNVVFVSSRLSPSIKVSPNILVSRQRISVSMTRLHDSNTRNSSKRKLHVLSFDENVSHKKTCLDVDHADEDASHAQHIGALSIETCPAGTTGHDTVDKADAKHDDTSRKFKNILSNSYIDEKETGSNTNVGNDIDIDERISNKHMEGRHSEDEANCDERNSNKHMEGRHSEDEAISDYSNVPEEPKNYKQCTICDVHFSSSTCYANHLVLHHHPAYSRKDVMKCPVCIESNKHYDSYFNSTLKIHLTNFHQLDEMKCLRCELCFDTYKDLHNHVSDCKKTFPTLLLPYTFKYTKTVQCPKCRMFHVFKSSQTANEQLEEVLGSLPDNEEVTVLINKNARHQENVVKQNQKANICCKLCKSEYNSLPCAVNHIVKTHMGGVNRNTRPLFKNADSNAIHCSKCNEMHMIGCLSFRSVRKYIYGNNYELKLPVKLDHSDCKALSVFRENLQKYFDFDLNNYSGYQGQQACKLCKTHVGQFWCCLNHVVRAHLDISNIEIVTKSRFCVRRNKRCSTCKTPHFFTSKDIRQFKMYLAAESNNHINSGKFSQRKWQSPSKVALANEIKNMMILNNKKRSAKSLKRRAVNVSCVTTKEEISIDMEERITHINGGFFCRLCHSEYKQYSCCKNHVLTEHSTYFGYRVGSEVYICPECSEVFYTLYFMDKHLGNTHNVFKFICLVCNKKFNTQLEYGSHMKHDNNNHGYIQTNTYEHLSCTTCGEIHNCTVQDGEEERIKSLPGQNEKIFQSVNENNSTDVNIETNAMATASVQAHHDSRSSVAFDGKCYVCLVCLTKFDRVMCCFTHSVVQHFRLAHLICDFCADEFRSKRSFVHHLKNIHNLDIFYCKTCYAGFMDKETLDLHSEECTNEVKHVPELIKDKLCLHCFSVHIGGSEEEVDRPCSECATGLPSIACANNHFYSKHLPRWVILASPTTVFKCPCGTKVLSRNELVLHVKNQHKTSIVAPTNIEPIDTSHAFYFDDVTSDEKPMCSRCVGCEHVHIITSNIVQRDSTIRKNRTKEPASRRKQRPRNGAPKQKSENEATCDKCHVTIPGPNCLQNHMLLEHEGKYKVRQCIGCGLFCTNEWTLKRHQNRESIELQEDNLEDIVKQKNKDLREDIEQNGADIEAQVLDDDKEDTNMLKIEESKEDSDIRKQIEPVAGGNRDDAKSQRKEDGLKDYKTDKKKRVHGVEYIETRWKDDGNEQHNSPINCTESATGTVDVCQRYKELIKCVNCEQLHQHKFTQEESPVMNAKSPEDIRNDQLKCEVGVRKIYKCTSCAYNTQDYKSFLEHRRTVHQRRIKDKKGENCLVCDQPTGKQIYLSQHIKSDHCQVTYLEGDVNDDFSNNFSCVYCEKTFTFMIDIQMHLRSKHFEKPLVVRKHYKQEYKGLLAIGRRVLQCPICLAVVNCNRQICDHVNVHFKDILGKVQHAKRFVCDICGNAYTTKYNLSDHRSGHLEIRNHKCNICLKTFRFLGNLETHMLTHSEKKEVCKVCDMKFRLPHHVRAHMKRQHNETCKS